MEMIVGIRKAISFITDHRQIGKVKHKLDDMLIIILFAVLAGINDIVNTVRWANLKEDVFRDHMNIQRIPSHDTICRVLAKISPEDMKAMFQQLRIFFDVPLNSNESEDYTQIISIDGKTSRRTGRNGQRPIHVVSAFISGSTQIVNQISCDKKSNEIKAILQLLEETDIEGKVATIDAMGTQIKIAESIFQKKGHYLLPVKRNQISLYECMEEFRIDFLKNPDMVKHTYHESVEKDHGRIEIRKCYAFDQVDLLDKHERWAGLKSFAYVVTRREKSDGSCTEEIRRYISTLPANAEEILKVARSHWGIENKLHYNMDVQYQDDLMRLRTGNSPFNMVIIRHAVMNFMTWVLSKKPELQKEYGRIFSFRMFINNDLENFVKMQVA